MNIKHQARLYNEGINGYNFAYSENTCIFFQKEINGKFFLIKLHLKDLHSKNYVEMFKNNITRL